LDDDPVGLPKQGRLLISKEKIGSPAYRYWEHAHLSASNFDIDSGHPAKGRSIDVG
jgi:hypothetical protein